MKLHRPALAALLLAAFSCGSGAAMLPAGMQGRGFTVHLAPAKTTAPAKPAAKPTPKAPAKPAAKPAAKAPAKPAAKTPAKTAAKPKAPAVNTTGMTAYQRFVATTRNYPSTMETYLDNELLKKATAKCPIRICLKQQRGRLYVDGKVAADWPVSTGGDGHETPTGSFSVNEKAKEHASTQFGKIVDAKGKVVKNNAEYGKDTIPAGCRFEGAPMPNWLRLCGGVGIHTGRVVAGMRLSHGCIRTPDAMAARLFKIADLGTPVTVAKDIEDNWPGKKPAATKKPQQTAKK